MKYSQKTDSFPITGEGIEIQTSKSRGELFEEIITLEDDESLLTQYYGDVTRYLGAFGIDKAYFEDAVQDTMVEALAGMDRIRDKTKSKYWVLKIAKRIGLKYIKKGKKEEASQFSYEEIASNNKEKIAFVSYRQLCAQVNLISDEELLEILEATLNVKEQRVIILYYVYDHKLKEIAKILNEPESTVRSISARAKKKLKERLEKG